MAKRQVVVNVDCGSKTDYYSGPVEEMTVEGVEEERLKILGTLAVGETLSILTFANNIVIIPVSRIISVAILDAEPRPEPDEGKEES